MIVIADSSPLNYLVLIGEADVLHRLYGRVVIPEAVFHELQHPKTPTAVCDWMAQRPEWLEVQHVTIPTPADFEALDPGESEAIVLAQANRPDVLLLMDEESGRQEATRRHIRTTGTLGVLKDAASRGFLDFSKVIERLRKTNFRVSESLLQSFLNQESERKKKQKQKP